MPIYDTSSKLVFEDPKPKRACHYVHCPNKGNYDGLKVKSCSKCTWVRYCSRECQAADWPEHKLVCDQPRLIDIGGWMETHAWLFRWAAYEALGRYNLNLTGTHSLFVDLTRTDRLVGPTPLAFIVEKMYIVPHDAAEKHWRIEQPIYSERDVQDAVALRRQGGLGVAIVVFRIEGPNETNMLRFQRFSFDEPRSRHPAAPEWEELVKGVANGDMPPSAIPKSPALPGRGR